MSAPLPYSDVVKLESFLWEECMILLPHPLDCAGWIYVIGTRDMALDEKTCNELKMSDEVLGLEIDFWDEIPRVKLYEKDIHRFLEDKDACKDLFEGFTRTYIQKIADGFDSHWLKKSAEVPDEKVSLRPQYILDWQAAPNKKGWQLPPTDKEEVVLIGEQPPEPKPITALGKSDTKVMGEAKKPAEETPTPKLPKTDTKVMSKGGVPAPEALEPKKKTDSRPNINPAEISLQEPDQAFADQMQELARQKLGQGGGLKQQTTTLKKTDDKTKAGLKKQETVTHIKKPQPKQPETDAGSSGSSSQQKSPGSHSSVTLRRMKPTV